MLNPNLTLENALERIGEPRAMNELVLSSRDDEVELFKSDVALFDRAVAEGAMKLNENGDQYVRTGQGKSGYFGLGYGFSALKTKVMSQFPWLKIEFDSGMVYNLEGTPRELQVLVHEMVMNAVEHGTDFCEKGNVTCRYVIGDKSQVWLIHQPTPGVSFYDERHMKVRGQDSKYLNAVGRIRGGGLATINGKRKDCGDPEFEVNSQNFPDGWGVVIWGR